eukprot:16431505-Heterocapsa_arctica.AAC.1
MPAIARRFLQVSVLPVAAAAASGSNSDCGAVAPASRASRPSELCFLSQIANARRRSELEQPAMYNVCA